LQHVTIQSLEKLKVKFSTAVSSHLPAQNSVANVMLKVLLALSPAILTSLLFLGAGVLIHLILAISTGLLSEAFILWLRKRPLKPSLFDLSATVTAVLLALSLPTLAPWWISVNGMLFAIIIAKHLYGGLGYNPFNPAMAGYAFLLISFPQPMTAWLAFDAPSLTLNETFQLIFHESLPPQLSFDALTHATPLDTIKTQLRLNQTLSQIHQLSLFGWLAGKSYQWISLSYLIGGVWLLKQKIIQWQIPAAFLGSLSALAVIAYLYDSDHFSSPLFHLFAGSTMLGAFFIATDPVTAATSNQGRLVYGALIGVLLYSIRIWDSYPDGLAFAVLLANLAVPSLDYFTKPKVYGQRR
jgi:electron transport complex protein RnfD